MKKLVAVFLMIVGLVFSAEAGQHEEKDNLASTPPSGHYTIATFFTPDGRLVNVYPDWEKSWNTPTPDGRYVESPNNFMSRTNTADFTSNAGLISFNVTPVIVVGPNYASNGGHILSPTDSTGTFIPLTSDKGFINENTGISILNSKNNEIILPTSTFNLEEGKNK